MVKALVLFHSQEYGNTGKMAEAVADGLRESGCEVDLFNTNESRFDVTTFPKYDCVALGSPDYYSYIAGGLKMFMDDHYIFDVRKGLKGLQDKPYALFCSHGGGGKVEEVMPRIFRRIGTQVGDLVSCIKTPDEQVLIRCKALGKQLGQTLVS